jgi:hypothetical protein
MTTKEMPIRGGIKYSHSLLSLAVATSLVHPVYVPLSDAEVREFRPVSIEKGVD